MIGQVSTIKGKPVYGKNSSDLLGFIPETGSILDEQSNEYFFSYFHQDGEDLHQNDRPLLKQSVWVSFTGSKVGNRFIARKITKLTPKRSKALLTEVSEWKVDAKNEDILKYFVEPPGFANLIAGETYIVTGRKGTGKTAIAQYINKSIDKFKNVKQISFQKSGLAGLLTNKLSSHSIFLRWKFLIYGGCQKFCVNGHLAGNCRLRQRSCNDRKQRTAGQPAGWLQETRRLDWRTRDTQATHQEAG